MNSNSNIEENRIKIIIQKINICNFQIGILILFPLLFPAIVSFLEYSEIVKCI